MDYLALQGRQLSNYRLERVLGRGGMGLVYYSWDINLDRPVAVKVIDARWKDDQSYARRFIQEARAIATWTHPNILQVYSAGEQDGLYFYAMEYIQGSDLEQVLTENARSGKLLPDKDILHIAHSVAAAIDYAHSNGVIHRDIKPGNILVAADGRVMLTDFGLALNISAGTLGEVFGSPHYIAPEQARNSANAVPASDIYAFGVVLYRMLSGALPFDDPSAAALALQHMTVDPPSPRRFNPKLNLAVEAVLLKVLQKDPALRYSSAEALVAELERALLDGQPGEVPKTVPIKDDINSPGVPTLLGNVPIQPPPTQTSLEPAASPDRTVAARSPAARAFSTRGLLWTAAGVCVLAAFACIAAVLAVRGLAPKALSGSPQATVGTSGLPPTSEEKAIISPVTPFSGGTNESGSAAPPLDSQVSAEAGSGFTVFYNQSSLYFLNRSGQDVPVNNFVFERLDKDGNPNGRWEGRNWGQIYANFRNGFCLVIREFGAKDLLEPKECRDRQLVVRTPTEAEGLIIWTSRNGASAFRVLWQKQEIARCPPDQGVCEFGLP